MGDRCNVYFKQADVYLYGHWSGWKIAETLRNALTRGKERWNDDQYLPRIVFCEMVKGSETELTGFGISHMLCDNNRPILVVDTQDLTVSKTGGSGTRREDVTKIVDTVSFANFIKMSDEAVREWHLGKEDE